MPRHRFFFIDCSCPIAFELFSWTLGLPFVTYTYTYRFSFSYILSGSLQWTKLVTGHRLSVYAVHFVLHRVVHLVQSLCSNWLTRLVSPVLASLWLRKPLTYELRSGLTATCKQHIVLSYFIVYPPILRWNCSETCRERIHTRLQKPIKALLVSEWIKLHIIDAAKASTDP